MSLATPTVCSELLGLRRGVYSATVPDGGLHLGAWPHTQYFGQLSAGQHAVLRSLANQARTQDELLALGAEHDGDAGADGVLQLLDQLRAGGWLKITISYRERAFYTLEPLRPPPPPPQDLESAAVLSRFAILHHDDDGLVLESPRAWCDIRVHDPAALSVLGSLTNPRPSLPPESLPADAGQRLIHDLRWADMAVPTPSDEDTEFRLRQWKPHELWFHERSRASYHSGLTEAYGRTLWAKGRFDPLPARPEAFPGPAIELHHPDLEALRRTDPTLTTILEDRQTIRSHDEDNPLTSAQLGEFLYRCARNRETATEDGVEYTGRPYPSGGGVCELELYPVVRHMADLESGMYHYDSHEHRLRLVREVTHPTVRRLLRASVPMGQQRPAQILLVISARVGRLMWSYEAMPYTLILKHVGILYQTMYCVATAMGLAPCGLGGGDTQAFNQATGRDPLVECSVGEFALGSRPPQGDPPEKASQPSA